MKRPLSIAHRGASGHFTENTMTAFEKALALGCGGIELDVMLSADGVPVVFHDESVKRLTGNEGMIANMKISQIRALQVIGGHKIPLLEEVMELVSGRCLLNIEIKSAGAAPAVARMISRSAGKLDCIVSSFDWNELKWLADEYPNIPLAVLTMTQLELAVDFAKFIRARAVHPHFHMLSAENTNAIQNAGLLVNCWTVNDTGDIGNLKNFGVDGIITDYPERV